MNPLGKSKKEEYSPEKAREMSAKVAKRTNPLISKKRANKIAEKVDKKQKKGVQM